MKSVRAIVWAAAIIEGEGCIIANKYAHTQFRLAVEMTDLDILIRLRDILGPHATLRERKPPSMNPKHNRRFILCLCGSELAGWLMTIYPIMGERRRRKIRAALEIWKGMRLVRRPVVARYSHLRIA